VASDDGVIRYELLDPERDGDGALVPNRGLLALPEPADGDLFFDIEGARYYSEDSRKFGLQYLFGVVDTAEVDEAGLTRYTQSWAFDRQGEKRAFEGHQDSRRKGCWTLLFLPGGSRTSSRQCRRSAPQDARHTARRPSTPAPRQPAMITIRDRNGRLQDEDHPKTTGGEHVLLNGIACSRLSPLPAGMIITWQRSSSQGSGTYRHLQTCVTGLLAKSGQTRPSGCGPALLVCADRCGSVVRARQRGIHLTISGVSA
jgi:hypothetical protein